MRTFLLLSDCWVAVVAKFKAVFNAFVNLGGMMLPSSPQHLTIRDSSKSTIIPYKKKYGYWFEVKVK